MLLREIREHGYMGGISQLKAWLVPLKKHEPEPLVRFTGESFRLKEKRKAGQALRRATSGA